MEEHTRAGSRENFSRDFETATRKPKPKRSPKQAIIDQKRSAQRAAQAVPERTGHGEIRVTPGSRKSLLIEVALELWRRGELRSVRVPEARGREDLDEAQMSRALIRSTVYQLEAVLREVLEGGQVVIVAGRLTGSSRTKLEGMGIELREDPPEDERRYLDMTPAVFVMGGVIMALRYVSLGMDDRVMYVIAGISMGVLMGIRPFINKMQRPSD